MHFRKVRDYNRTLHMYCFKIFRSPNVLKFLVRLFLCLSSSLECSSPNTVTVGVSVELSLWPARPAAVIDSSLQRLSESVCVCVCVVVVVVVVCVLLLLLLLLLSAGCTQTRHNQ